MQRVLRLVGAVALTLATVLLAGTSPSAASSYTLNFTGHVTSAGGTFGTQGFLPGDTISGTLTFDPFNATTTRAGAPDPTVDQFDQAASSFTFHIANPTAHLDSSGSGSGSINSTSFGSRDLDFSFDGFDAASDKSALTLQFSTFSGNPALSSLTGLPGTAGGIIAFLGGSPLSATGSFQVGLLAEDAVQFDLNLAATPIPATLPLFATALLGTGLLGWRRARHRA